MTMDGMPVHVLGLVRVVGKTVETPLIEIPGIGGGAAYGAGDAFGTKFIIDGVPKSGVIHTAIFLDKDDEGIETDLMLFRDDFTATADNDAFAVVDADMEKFIGSVTWVAFKNLGANQVSTAAALGLVYVAPLGRLFCQCVTRGAPNIAAGSEPKIRLLILSDDE